MSNQQLAWHGVGVTILRGDHSEAQARIDSIVTLYGESSRYVASCPDELYVGFVDGLEGGFVVDCSMGGMSSVGRIMFAAFEQAHCRKGNATRLIAAFPALIGVTLEAVELNPFDLKEPWQKLGFTIDGMINFVQVLSTRPISEIYPTSVHHDCKEGLPLDVLFKGFAGMGKPNPLAGLSSDGTNGLGDLIMAEMKRSGLFD
ncbi:hypothetical protein [Thaumasiovibrio sp. DFM-14]|uniref:hypothetical protein n=1 Tax=Thaumasiovibrio sp. DFM-14 TaxID=3384792 RepID=UPI0039A13E9F